MKNYVYLIFFLTTLSVDYLSAQGYESYKVLKDTIITSDELGFEKEVSITVPFEWQKNTLIKYPVIFVFDKFNQRQHNYILNAIDYLTSTDQMPSAIIISINSSQENRYKETSYNVSNSKGLAKENEQFLFNELIPFAEKELNASKFRLFIGHSRYGYFTTSLLSNRIDQLNAIIALSPFFIQKNVNLIDSISDIAPNKLDFTKYYRFTIGNDYPDEFQKMGAVIKKFLNTKFNVKGTHFKNADHYATPGLYINQSLYEIFEFWNIQQQKYFSEHLNGLSIINDLSTEIYSNYGVDIKFSLGVLNGKGWFFFNKKEYKNAIASWNILLRSYPNFSEAYLYIIETQIQLNLKIEETEKEFLKSLEVSDIYAENEKIELLKELKLLKNNK